MQLQYKFFPIGVMPYNPNKAYFRLRFFSKSQDLYEFGYGWKLTFGFVDLFDFEPKTFNLILYLKNFLSYQQQFNYKDIILIILGIRLHYCNVNQ